MVENKLNPEALVSYTKSFSTIILDRFFDENQTITGQQIVDLTPIKQLNFFILKALFSQWQEETKKFKSPFFDYNNEAVKSSLKTLVNTLSKHISIERDPFSPLFESAVHDTLTLIYEPKSFFKNEISSFSGSNYVSSFKSLSKYVKIRKDVFNRISEELNEGNIQQGGFEIESLIHQACDSLTLDDIESEVNLFDQILPMDVLETSEDPIVGDKVEKKIITSVPVENLVQDKVPEERHDEHGNLDEQFDPTNDKESETEAVVNVNDQFSDTKPIINEQFEEETKTATVVEKHQTEKVSELHSSISVNQRYMFVNDLFEGNVSEYNQAIEVIEECESFDDSVEQLMQNYSRKFQWDMSSDEVKELLKVIFKKFR